MASLAPGDLQARLAAEQRKLAAVRELSRALGANLGLDCLLRTIVQKVPELLDAERATLYLLEDGGGAQGDAELVSKVVMGGLGPSPGVEAEPPLIQQIRLRLGEGIAGVVAQTCAPLNIPDAYQDPRFNPEVDRRTGFHTRSILCVPIQDHAGRVSGVLQALNRRDGAPFDEDDEALLAAMAAYIGVSLDNSKLYEDLLRKHEDLLRTQRDLQQRITELDLLYRIERESAAAMDLEELLGRLSRRAMELLGGEAGLVALRLPSGELDVTFCRLEGQEVAAPQRARLDRSDGIIGWAVQQRQVVMSHQVPGDARDAGRTERLLGLPVRQALVVPLEHAEAAVGEDGDLALGAIAVINKRDGLFGQDDQKLLTLIAGQAVRAIMLERTRMLRVRESNLASIGRMLASVMHDLRAPMTIISGYAQMMASSDDPVERERFVRMINKQFDLMAAMTGEVMAFARGETKLLVRRVLLTRFVEEVREQLEREVPPGVKLQLEPEYLGPAYFDELKLLRLVHNLARNAIQAMPEGGTLRIGIRAEGGELIFTFSDTGGGLPEEIQPHLFEAFVSSRRDGGTGLGLAIVKKIVDDHKGRISVSTSRGEGTTFTVAIPLTRE
ncbi:MAG: GAF domain-containing sensor histidine kinase [Myxococcales bacterium]|nr:GAF domain-containing sensor histidine kinase [Myxococcota bacterium]MDW8280135.1 GAF domain-containing sensor histidine kinase [Myxococcales bacterium]